MEAWFRCELAIKWLTHMLNSYTKHLQWLFLPFNLQASLICQNTNEHHTTVTRTGSCKVGCGEHKNFVNNKIFLNDQQLKINSKLKQIISLRCFCQHWHMWALSSFTAALVLDTWYVHFLLHPITPQNAEHTAWTALPQIPCCSKWSSGLYANIKASFITTKQFCTIVPQCVVKD